MNKNLLIETHLFEAKVQEESNGTLLVRGILQRAGAPNQNKRRYPKEILEREVKKYQQLIKERRALGELDHPESPIINLKNVSHNIREVWWDGDDVVGVVEILSTPAGNILRELLKNNIRLGISSRGLGSVKEMNDGTVLVQEDFELVGWDFVSNPSTYGAFMSPMNLKENVEYQKVIEECGKWCKAQDLMREILIELN
jgi:hypothetical protein